MRKLQIGQHSFSAVITKEGDQYCSWCPELDVASCGDTREEAFDMLREAVELYLNTLQEEGELEAVLSQKGIF